MRSFDIKMKGISSLITEVIFIVSIIILIGLTVYIISERLKGAI